MTEVARYEAPYDAMGKIVLSHRIMIDMESDAARRFGRVDDIDDLYTTWTDGDEWVLERADC